MTDTATHTITPRPGADFLTYALQDGPPAPTAAARAFADWYMADLAVEVDLFGEAAEQLGIDVTGLPERLAPYVPAFPGCFGTHQPIAAE